MILPLLLALAAPQDTTHLSLGAAVDAASRSYPSIAVARADVDRAAAAAGSARSALMPHVRLDASITRFQEPMIVYPLHSLNLVNPPVFDRTLVQPGASASYTVFDFGARRARIDAAIAIEDAASTRQGGAEQDVITRVVDEYLRVVTARQIASADHDEVLAVSAEVDRATKFFAVGKSAQVDVLRAESALQRAVAEEESGAADLEVSERALAEVTGLGYAAVHLARLDSLRVADTTLAADTTEAARDALIQRALAGNADARAAERQVAATRATAAAARAMRWPVVQASGGYLAPGSIDGNFHPDWQVGVSMSYSLYSGGATSTAIDAADADVGAAQASLRLVSLGVESVIDQDRAALRQATARAAALQRAASQAAEVVRIEALSRDVGEGTQTDYLTAVADLLQTRASLIEARQAELAARVQLAHLTGELSADWIARNIEPLP